MSPRTRRRGTAAANPRRARRGASIVEVMVGIVIMAVGLLGLAQAATIGMIQSTHARDDSRYAADLQQVSDSLLTLGYGKVATGSETIRGRTVKWTVTTPGTNSQLITIVAERRSEQKIATAAADTLSLYFAKGTPGS